MSSEKLSFDELVKHTANGNIQWLTNLIEGGVTRVDIIVYRAKERGIERTELRRIKRSISIQSYRDYDGAYRWRMKTNDEMMREMREYQAEQKRKRGS